MFKKIKNKIKDNIVENDEKIEEPEVEEPEVEENNENDENFNNNTNVEEIQDVEKNEESEIDNDISELNDDVEINSISDIDSISNKFKIPKKLIIFIVGLFILVLSLFFLYNLYEDISTKNKNNSNDEIDIDVIVESQNEEDYISTNEEKVSKSGTIKRILGDKIIIIPNGESEPITYLIDKDLLNDLSMGMSIEYKYTIENYIPSIFEVNKIISGTILNKGIMTISVESNSEIFKYSFSDELSEKIKTISNGDKIEYITNNSSNENIENISEIFKVHKKIEVEAEEEDIDNEYNSNYVFDKTDFYGEYLIIENRSEEPIEVISSNIKDDTINFYNGITKPIWIRFAWRVTDLTSNVPNINNLNVTLESPSGKRINKSNVEEFGRFWVENNVINFAIRSPEVGDYKIITSKPKGTDLGEAQIFLMELSGFITIDKFGANLIDQNNLELIWNIGGVPDDGLEIEVHLTNDKFSTVIFESSSKEENLHIIDKRTVDVSHIPRGQYDIIVKVKDIDIKTNEDSPEIPENTLLISAETISDTKNVGILILQ